MNQQYDNTNRGALFKNNKRMNDRAPEFTGKLNVGGVDYYVSGWRKTRENADPFISLSVESKAEAEAKKAQRMGAAAPAPARAALDDEIPF